MDLEELGRLAASDNPQERRRAARQGELCEDLRAARILFPLAKADPDPGVRYVARSALKVFVRRMRDLEQELRQIPDLFPRGPEPLPEISRDYVALLLNPDPAQRRETVIEIGDRRLVSMRAKLVEMLDLESEGWVRAEVARTLGLLGDGSGTREALLECLRDPVSRTRANAVEALGLLRSPGYQDQIEPLLQDPNRRVRANAVQALAASHWHRVEGTLRSLVESADALDRQAALFVLRSLSASRRAASLEFLSKDKDPGIQRQARDLLEGDRSRFRTSSPG